MSKVEQHCVEDDARKLSGFFGKRGSPIIMICLQRFNKTIKEFGQSNAVDFLFIDGEAPALHIHDVKL